MPQAPIRQAVLDDARTISALFCAEIERWQRINPKGQVEDLSYDALSIYDRWLHGGPWMSVETAAIWLSHLLRAQCIPWVLEEGGEIAAYAEIYPGQEPQPFGLHWHIGRFVLHPSHRNSPAFETLLQFILQQRPGPLTIALSGYDSETVSRYSQYGFGLLAQFTRYQIAAQTGQSFYKAVEHPNDDSAQIRGWNLLIGRQESARQHWESLWPSLWMAVPQIAQRKVHRLHFSASGHESFLCCQTQLYDPRSADIFCWSPKPLTAQLLIGIRDWAHRSGYRTLSMVVDEKTARLFGAEAEPHPQTQLIYAAGHA